MIIPGKDPDKFEKVMFLRDTCLQSRSDRKARYDRRKRYFMYGTYGQQKALYNRLYAHTDLVASFLYSAEHLRYALAASPNSPEPITQQAQALQDFWNEDVAETGLSQQYGHGLLWALCYDSMFLKLGWNNRNDELFGKLLPPYSFGVFDETEPDLGSQEAFVHCYRLDWDNAVLRLLRAGLRDRIKDLSTVVKRENTDLPPVLANMIIGATGGTNLSGPVIGQATPDYEVETIYEAETDAPGVEFQELYVWDDLAEDYRIFTIASPDIILADSKETIAAMSKASKPPGGPKYESETNIFIPEEHPFVHICPYPLFDYFWGESHVDRLIPLQKWTNERLDQIHEILESQVDPARVFSGFMGLSDEKAGAFGGPGSWVTDSLPNAKVEDHPLKMPENLFDDYDQIGKIFLEASGLTETVTGKGEGAVRSKGHAKQLATTGSGRIRKVATGLEPSLVKLGDTGLKLTMKNSTDKLRTADGGELLPSQFAERNWHMRVNGHSHSPLFAEESREMAALLLKAQAIDREMFVRLLHPMNEDNIIHALRKRVAQEAHARATNPALTAVGGGKGRRV